MRKYSRFGLYLLDMDGTIYFENSLIPGAYEFINKLKEENIPYVFISNNSSVSKSTYLEKLANLGIPCSEDNLFSSAMAMGLYLKENYLDKKVFVVGTKLFKDELLNYGINLVDDDSADILVVGYDRELTYEKLEVACRLLDGDVIFLATNPDFVYPLKNKRYLPDCGSICNMLTVATGKSPNYIGKPNPFIIDYLKKKFGVRNEDVVVVGDRLYTDIQLAINANVNSILVLTGEATKEMLEESKVKPNYVVDSIKDLI